MQQKSKFSVQRQHTLLLASFLDEEFDFQDHGCSKTGKSNDLHQKSFRVINNVSEWLIMFSRLANDHPTSTSFCNLAKGHEFHPKMCKTLLITCWSYYHIVLVPNIYCIISSPHGTLAIVKGVRVYVSQRLLVKRPRSTILTGSHHGRIATWTDSHHLDRYRSGY